MSHPIPAPKQNQRKTLPDLETLDRFLRLDVETGILWRRVKVPKMRPDWQAGSLDSQGYLYAMVSGCRYMVHRIVWKLHWREEPPEYIDHENRVKTDNRPSNLREATAAMNSANAGVPRHNKSGVKGVNYCPRKKRWRARIRIKGAEVGLGYHRTKDSAARAVQAAREQVHGAFARHE